MIKNSIKILGVNFGNSILDNENKGRYSKKKLHISDRVRLSLRGKKIIANQTLLSKLQPNLQFSKIYQKRIYDFLWNRKKMQPPGRLAQLSIWTSGLGILDIKTQLNSLKIKWIQRLLNPTNALQKNLMMYQLNLILNYNQGLALFKQRWILRSTLVKNIYKNKTMKISLFDFSNNFPVPTSVKIILDQFATFLNPQSKLATCFLQHPTQEYFGQIYNYLLPQS